MEARTIPLFGRSFSCGGSILGAAEGQRSHFTLDDYDQHDDQMLSYNFCSCSASTRAERPIEDGE